MCLSSGNFSQAVAHASVHLMQHSQAWAANGLWRATRAAAVWQHSAQSMQVCRVAACSFFPAANASAQWWKHMLHSIAHAAHTFAQAAKCSWWPSSFLVVRERLPTPGEDRGPRPDSGQNFSTIHNSLQLNEGQKCANRNARGRHFCQDGENESHVLPSASRYVQPEQQEPLPLLSPGFDASVFCISLPQHEGTFWSASTVLVIPHAMHL